MADEDDINIEVLEEPRTIAGIKGYTLIELVVLHHKEVVYLKTSGEPFDLTSSLLGNEKSLAAFESMLEKKSKEICGKLSLPL